MKSLKEKTVLYPMPVLIIATYNDDGTANAMNAAWGGMYDYEMITVSLSEHRTTSNILKQKAFTISVADAKHVVEADYVGIVSGNQVPDKVTRCGLTVSKSENVNAPIINEFPITLECELVSLENGTLIGKIKNVLAREDILAEDGLPDLSKFAPITYDPFRHKYIALGECVGNAFSDGKKVK